MSGSAADKIKDEEDEAAKEEDVNKRRQETVGVKNEVNEASFNAYLEIIDDRKRRSKLQSEIDSTVKELQHNFM